MTDVSYIQKDAHNSHGNYNYASEYAIKMALHKAFVEHGVIMQLSVEDARVETLEPSKQGRDTKVFILKTAYTFHDVDSSDKLSGTFIGCGQGRDDKGANAAVTTNIKYILTSMFLIPTGDDPENDGNNGNNGNNGKGNATPPLAAKQTPPPPAKEAAPKNRRTHKQICFGALKKYSGFQASSEAEFDAIMGNVCSRECAQPLCLDNEIETLFLPGGDGIVMPNDPGWEAATKLLAVMPKNELDQAIMEATATSAKG